MGTSKIQNPRVAPKLYDTEISLKTAAVTVNLSGKKEAEIENTTE